MSEAKPVKSMQPLPMVLRTLHTPRMSLARRNSLLTTAERSSHKTRSHNSASAARNTRIAI